MRISVRIMLSLLLISACGSEPDDRVFGTYLLVGVDGNSLPYLFSSDAECDLFIAEGELTLNEAGTFALEFLGPYDCSKSGGPAGDQSLGRIYSGTFTQSQGNLEFEAPLEGGGTLEFSGRANPLEAAVTVPPVPPQAGPDLDLQFAIAQQ